jgi:hypothetical protein
MQISCTGADGAFSKPSDFELKRRICRVARHAADPLAAIALPHNLNLLNDERPVLVQLGKDAARADVGIVSVEEYVIGTTKGRLHRIAPNLHHRHPSEFGGLKPKIGFDKNRNSVGHRLVVEPRQRFECAGALFLMAMKRLPAALRWAL